MCENPNQINQQEQVGKDYDPREHLLPYNARGISLPGKKADQIVTPLLIRHESSTVSCTLKMDYSPL